MANWKKLKTSPHLWDKIFIKEKTIHAIRKFFELRNYHELESPILATALPQEHYLNPVTTTFSLKGKEPKTLYLIPSTERFNKIALAAGIGEHFVITKVFRGLEDVSPNHSPEFTMLEWYHLDANYFDLMDDCEELLNFIFVEIFNKQPAKLNYQGQEIDLRPGWDKINLVKALKEWSGIELPNIQDVVAFRKKMISKGYSIDDNDDWEILFELLFANEIEPRLAVNKPSFVYNYPKQLCPLTRLNKENPLVAEKVELYIAGKELANGYTELLNGFELEKNFKAEEQARAEIKKEPIAFDHELIEALKSGMPKVAGIGMGLDRLAMLFADAASLEEVNLFPGTELLN